jgi:hypothetical protein
MEKAERRRMNGVTGGSQCPNGHELLAGFSFNRPGRGQWRDAKPGGYATQAAQVQLFPPDKENCHWTHNIREE